MRRGSFDVGGEGISILRGREFPGYGSRVRLGSMRRQSPATLCSHTVDSVTVREGGGLMGGEESFFSLVLEVTGLSVLMVLRLIMAGEGIVE